MDIFQVLGLEFLTTLTINEGSILVVLIFYIVLEFFSILCEADIHSLIPETSNHSGHLRINKLCIQVSHQTHHFIISPTLLDYGT